VPCFVDVRDPWPDSFRGSVSGLRALAQRPLFWHYRRLLRRSLRDSTGVLSMSRRMMEWSLERAGRGQGPQDRIFYLGHESGGGRPGRLEAPAAFTRERPLRCIFYGMFGSCHNGEVVIRAARRLLEDARGESVRFVLAGDGPLRGAWEALAAGLPNVEFSGWLGREQAAKSLASCHLGVIAIAGEVNRFWFGNKFFEYLSQGLAVINDTEGELAATVSEEGIGCNIPPGDDEALAEAVRRLRDDPAELHAARERALRLFDQRYSAAVIDEAYARFVLAAAEDG
jgi:hypothetical protein